MGFKKTNEYHLITNGVMTGTTTILSAAFNIENVDNIGIQVDWTSTAVGTISVLASIDGVTYHALTFDPVLAQPAGTAGGYVIDLNQVPFPWLKVKYVNTSSTGILNVYIFSKDVN